MHFARNCFAALLLALTASLTADDNGVLGVEFDTPVASITPRSANRPLSLPNLTYVVRAQASCPASLSAESISISIADTRFIVRPDESGEIEESIRVPNKQLGPVAVGEFCLAESITDSQELLQIDDVFTSHLSLHCVGENSESITYSTAALDVILRCDAAKPEEI